MMKIFGYHTIEYANEGSSSQANEKVVMLTKTEFDSFYKPEKTSPAHQAKYGSPAWKLFDDRLKRALRSKLKPGDIVAHTIGPKLYADLVPMFPRAIHVETGIGYPHEAYGCAAMIFESEAWRHYQWGRKGNQGGGIDHRLELSPETTWVVPNYFDVDDWKFQEKPASPPYVTFMHRFVQDKGIEMLREIVKGWVLRYPKSNLRFVLAGMGDYKDWLEKADFTKEEKAKIEYKGIVLGRQRAKLLGGATAFLMPTIFVEPFGGAAVESMLCGTPVLSSDFGAFTETVTNGVTGFRCKTTASYVEAISACLEGAVSRLGTYHTAMEKYSLETCGSQYDRIFKTLSG